MLVAMTFASVRVGVTLSHSHAFIVETNFMFQFCITHRFDWSVVSLN